MLTEFFSPHFKLTRPLFLVFLKIIFTIENEFKLVVSVIGVSEYPRKGNVEFVQMTEVHTFVIPDLFAHIIGYSQWVISQQVFHFYEIDQVIEQRISETKLCLFENIILIKRKEFAKHDS